MVILMQSKKKTTAHWENLSGSDISQNSKHSKILLRTESIQLAIISKIHNFQLIHFFEKCKVT